MSENKWTRNSELALYDHNFLKLFNIIKYIALWNEYRADVVPKILAKKERHKEIN